MELQSVWDHEPNGSKGQANHLVRERAVRLVRRTGAAIDLVDVTPPWGRDPSPAQKRLARHAMELRGNGLHATSEVMHGWAAEQLAARAKALC